MAAGVECYGIGQPTEFLVVGFPYSTDSARTDTFENVILPDRYARHLHV
jgi:hypothetical protein